LSARLIEPERNGSYVHATTKSERLANMGVVSRRRAAYNPVRWKGGRVVEGTGLENRQWGNSLVGSNPTPSARTFVFKLRPERAPQMSYRASFRGIDRQRRQGLSSTIGQANQDFSWSESLSRKVRDGSQPSDTISPLTGTRPPDRTCADTGQFPFATRSTFHTLPR
jgi:hypothetical protein